MIKTRRDKELKVISVLIKNPRVKNKTLCNLTKIKSSTCTEIIQRILKNKEIFFSCFIFGEKFTGEELRRLAELQKDLK